jgi:UDP-perosamine 4-acetyltransferase
VLLIGAGGHARVCVEALLDMGDAVIVGAVSSNGTTIDGLGVSPCWPEAELEEAIRASDATACCVAIGDNATRRRFADSLVERGIALASAVSASSVVSRTARLGAGVQLIAGCVVNAATVVGDGAIVNTNATIDHDCSIGRFVHVAPGAVLGGAVTVGDEAMIGLGARVLPGIRIGAGAIVGAGAVVTRDVEANTVVVGVPARPHVRTRATE